MRQKILVTAPYLQPHIDRFRSIFEKNHMDLVLPEVQERLSENDLLTCMDGVVGVISGDDQFTERVLRQAKDLRVISKWGTGIDSIDVEACRRLNIKVCNTPNAFSEPVADSVIGYMICFARRLLAMDADMKNGAWCKIPGKSLSECILGVIGVGDVGKAVVRRAAAFGMKMLGNDLVEMPREFIQTTGIQMTTKNELLENADFVSLNCDLNPTSFHLINENELVSMKPTAYVINTARGQLIDENALISALKTKKIAGAALDVFEEEPLPLDSPLRQMDNVFLAPHNANSSPLAWERVHRNTIRNLLDRLNLPTQMVA